MRPYLRVANVFEDRIDTRDVKSMHFDPEDFERFRLTPGDVLLNEGQSPEFLGRPAIYRGDPPDVAFTNSVLRFRPFPNVSSEWALAVFRHHMWSGRFKRESRITTNIAHLSAGRLSGVEFRVPPLAAQHRIVEAIEEAFSKLDAGEAGLRATRQRLKRLRDSVLSAAVAGQLVGRDPGEWRQADLGEVAEIKGGIQKQPKRVPNKSAAPFLRVANVGRGTLDLTDVHQIELFDGELERLRLQPGDLLVVEGNGSPDQIGRAAMWHGEIDPCVHQNHLIRVRPSADLAPAYLELYWNSPDASRRVQAVASSTSGLHTLSTGKLKSLPVAIPPLAEQQRIVAEAERQFSFIEVAEQAVDAGLARCATLRRAVLKAAFEGRLVPQDPSDEPASVLLERIRAERAAAPPATKQRRRKAAG
jgi:type I restriction enzyme S subunit